MRSDIVPGSLFPDYELSDHTAKRRKLSELQGPHPMVLVLSRGGFCPKLKDLGLTYPQYLVMVVLQEQNGLAVKEVGELLHLDSGTLTPLLKRLEKMGLIKRERNSEDERKVLISLTRTGDHLRKKALGIPGKVSCSLGISSKNADALQKAILNARDHIRAHRNSFDPEPIES